MFKDLVGATLGHAESAIGVSRPLQYGAGMAQSEGPPLAEIERFFLDRDFDIVVHQEPPPNPTDEQWRSMSSIERKARRHLSYSHWADLRQRVTLRPVRWYGGGMSDEEAVRSAYARWCVEQEGGSPPGERSLP